uniref:Secreted protein n=1 Tax=Anopheles coluzzii TaxID=1518534 RepID=A0A8W7P5B5_ANOCL
MARLILVWLALCAATVLASGSAVPPSAWSSRVHRTARDTMGDGRDHHAAAQPRSMLSCDRVNNFFSSINVTVSQAYSPRSSTRKRSAHRYEKLKNPFPVPGGMLLINVA